MVQNVIFSSEKCFFCPVRNGTKIIGQFQNRFRLIEGQDTSFLIHKIKIEKLRKEKNVQAQDVIFLEILGT